jgi:hypothetical protein
MVIIQPDSTLLCGSDLAAGILCPQGTSALLPPSQLKTGDFPTSCDEMQMGLIPYLVGGFNHLEKCLKPPTSYFFLWERKEKHVIPCLTTYVFFFLWRCGDLDAFLNMFGLIVTNPNIRIGSHQ